MHIINPMTYKIVAQKIAASACAAYDCVYVNSDGKIVPGDASAESTARIFGVIESAIAANKGGLVTTFGLIQNPNWNFTPNTVLFLDENSNKLTQLQPITPGKFMCVVAFALERTKVLIAPRFDAVTEVLD